MTVIRLPAVLRDHAGGVATVDVEGATVGEVLSALGAQFPGVARRVMDEQGSIRRHVHVYVGEERARSLDEAVPAGVEVAILAAVSGGAGA